MEDLLFGLFLGVVVGGLGGAAISHEIATDAMEKQAVSLGHGYYSVNFKDQLEFKWSDDRRNKD